MASEFSILERNILKAKGASDEMIAALQASGVASRADFQTVGDAETLAQLVPGWDTEVAGRVMEWATGGAPKRAEAPMAPVTAVAAGPVLVDSADVVYCIHCRAKQPKDYKSGDLCLACGKQAEPILSCFWCSSSGPGRYCRSCGAEFVPTGELDLAVLLRREGMPKEEIPRKLKALGAAEKDDLWGRVRRSRG